MTDTCALFTGVETHFTTSSSLGNENTAFRHQQTKLTHPRIDYLDVKRIVIKLKWSEVAEKRVIFGNYHPLQQHGRPTSHNKSVSQGILTYKCKDITRVKLQIPKTPIKYRQ